MKLERILRTGIALGFLGLGILGCSSNSRKELDKGIIFEQKSDIDYKGNLSKVVDGVKIDASFSNPKNHTFYDDGGIRAGLWSEVDFPKETTSGAINSWLCEPYLQEVGIKNAKNITAYNESTEAKRQEIRKNGGDPRLWSYEARNQGVQEKEPQSSETRLTDYFHDDGKPEAFAVPVISEKKFGVHVFFDKDYIKKIKNPEVAMVYFIAGEKRAGEFFSYLGKINLKKANGAYCGYFEISNMPKYQTIFLVGDFRTKENRIPISSTSERTELINNLQCSKKLAEIIGDDDCIILGFSERLYE